MVRRTECQFYTTRQNTFQQNPLCTKDNIEKDILYKRSSICTKAQTHPGNTQLKQFHYNWWMQTYVILARLNMFNGTSAITKGNLSVMEGDLGDFW